MWPANSDNRALCYLASAALILALGCVSLAGKQSAMLAADEKLLEVRGNIARPPLVTSPAEIKIVTYNIRWRSGDALHRLIDLLREDPEIGGASIIGLQEVDRHKKRTQYTNTAREIAERLGMNYAWAAPPSNGEEEETGVMILSPYPLSEVKRILLPNTGPKGRRRVALGATVNLGKTRIRVYSVHAETRINGGKRLEQFRAVVEEARAYQAMQTVILGDFNTIGEEAVRGTRRLFAASGFSTPFPDSQPTWKWFVIDFKLDWMWLRNLQQPTACGIAKHIDLSDHWPLWVKIKL
jgi:endonuclease/exonuclease/phosphatase family metal-dependent hydrolase